MKLLDVDQAAGLLGLSPLTIRKWLRSGKLKGTKIGKEWRIDAAELNPFYPDLEIKEEEVEFKKKLLHGEATLEEIINYVHENHPEKTNEDHFYDELERYLLIDVAEHTNELRKKYKIELGWKEIIAELEKRKK